MNRNALCLVLALGCLCVALPLAAQSEASTIIETINNKSIIKLALLTVMKNPPQNPAPPDMAANNCTAFIANAVRKLGTQVYEDIMPLVCDSPNDLFIAWRKNTYLLQLGNNDSAWVSAARYANQGYLVLAASTSQGNQAGFVCPRIVGIKPVEYSPFPFFDLAKRPYVNPLRGDANYRGEIKRDWPAFLQAGLYSGIVSPRWAFNPFLIANKRVYFFVYTGHTPQR